MGADVDLIRRLAEDGFLKGDAGVVAGLLADDYVDHDPPPGMPGNKEGTVALVEMISSAFHGRHARRPRRGRDGRRPGGRALGD